MKQSEAASFSPSGMGLVLGAWGLWSLDPIVTYLIGEGTPRLLLAGVSMLFGGVALGFWTWRGLRKARRLSKRDWTVLLLLGVLFTGLADLCYVGAIRWMNPGLVGAVLRSQVAFAVLLAAVLLGERMNRTALAGITLILGANGLMFIAALQKTGAADGAHGAVMGWLLAFAAALLWSCATVSSKFLLNRFRPFELSGLRMLMGGGVLFIAALAFDGTESIAALSGRQWGLLAVKGVVTSALAFSLYFVGLRRVPVYVASAMEPFAPLFTLLIAWLWLEKGLSGLQMASVAVLLCGTVCVILGNYRQARARASAVAAP